MSDFEYLSVLIAIIVGIGFTHLLLSIGRILGETKSLNVTLVHMIWTANILIMLVSFWWWAMNLRELEEWAFLTLLFLLFDVSLWCLMAAILYPVAIPQNYDLKAHFARKRKAFFSILILLAFADPVTSMILGTEHLIDLGWPYLHWMLTCLIGGSLAIRYENERFHKVFGIYWGFRFCCSFFPGSFQSRPEIRSTH
jgi:hypothetical protein